MPDAFILVAYAFVVPVGAVSFAAAFGLLFALARTDVEEHGATAYVGIGGVG